MSESEIIRSTELIFQVIIHCDIDVMRDMDTSDLKHRHFGFFHGIYICFDQVINH